MKSRAHDGDDAAVDDVGGVALEQRLGAGHRVVAGAAVEHVVAEAAEEHVVAADAADERRDLTIAAAGALGEP